MCQEAAWLKLVGFQPSAVKRSPGFGIREGGTIQRTDPKVVSPYTLGLLA